VKTVAFELGLKSHLGSVGDWVSIARTAGYHSREVARSCRISPRQLERFVREEFGQSPQEWLDALRLKQAAALMLGGSHVKEAAYELGFSHPSHFIRKFKALYHCTPMSFFTERCQTGSHALDPSSEGPGTDWGTREHFAGPRMAEHQATRPALKAAPRSRLAGYDRMKS
jgi:AraC-like DNA-binding protein